MSEMVKYGTCWFVVEFYMLVLNVFGAFDKKSVTLTRLLIWWHQWRNAHSHSVYTIQNVQLISWISYAVINWVFTTSQLTKCLYMACNDDVCSVVVFIYALNLESLELRRLCADLLLAYKILFHLLFLNSDAFFTPRNQLHLRSHPYVLDKSPS